MNLLEDFKNKLLGLYHNRNQAYTNPQMWAHIFTKIEENDRGEIISKSWYAIEDENNPYKKVSLELKETQNKIIVTPYNIDNGYKTCDIEFSYDGQFWIGENEKCEIIDRGIYISTSIKFDGINYFSRDAGYDLSNRNFLWGKQKHEGMFHFIKV
jgi:hypothetical protein